MSTTQAALGDFESRNVGLGTDHLPYEVPYQTGNRESAREAHRKFYWQIFDRESYECPDCGLGIGDIHRFEVHHLDRDPLNGRLWNLVAVCQNCHQKRHAAGNPISLLRLDEWKDEFVALGED